MTNRKKLNIIGYVMALLVSAGLVLSAPVVSAPITPKAAPVAVKQVWNLKDADIRAVIQTMAALTGKNFIVDPRVSGRVSLISNRPMSTDEIYHVFLSMLQVLNYAAVPSGNVIKIIPAVSAKEYAAPLSTAKHPGSGDEVVVRVVQVKYASAMQLVSILRPLMQDWGSISVYSATNSLILAGLADNMQRLIDIVHRIDQQNYTQTQVIGLRYANAKSLVALIKSLFSGRPEGSQLSGLSIAADEDTNEVLVNGTLAQILRLQQLVKRLDRPQSTMNSETAVIKLQYLDAKKIAPILTKIVNGESATSSNETSKSSKSTGTTTGKFSIQAEPVNNVLIVHAAHKMIRSIKQVVASLDKQPQEVLVEAIIVNIDQTLMNKLGVVWGTVDGSGQGLGGAAVSNSFNLKVSHGIGFIGGTQIQALVQALMSDSSTEVLATPSIMVLNNGKATIQDGTNIGYANRSYDSGSSGSNSGDQNQTNNDSSDGSGGSGGNTTDFQPYNTFQRKDIGLKLEVTPRISPNHSLQLKIVENDDSLGPDYSASQQNPSFLTSKIETTVLVKSGDILVLGGLIRHDRQKGESKVPILGDIPILGQLFRYNTDTMDKKNLMVFIRPIILSSQHDGYAQTVHSYVNLRHDQSLSEHFASLLHHSLPIPAPRVLSRHRRPAATRRLLPPPTRRKAPYHERYRRP